MCDKEFFNNKIIPFNLIFDQFDDGVLLIKENKVVYGNEKISTILELDNNLPFPLLVDLFPASIFEKLTIEIINYNHVNPQIFKFSKDVLKYNLEIKISGFESDQVKYTLLVVKAFEKPNITPNLANNYLAELVPFILLETNIKGHIIAYNRQFEKQLNYTGIDLTEGFAFNELFASSSDYKLPELLNNYNKIDSIGKVEVLLKQKSGELLHTEMHYKAKVDGDCFNGYFLLFVDVTQNKQIETKFYQNQQRLRTVLDLVPHMIFLKDSEGNILLANKACADFYSTTTKELVYSNISQFHKNQAEFERIKSEDKEVIALKERKEWPNSILTDNNNKEYIFKTTKVPFIEPDSEQVHALGILVDITQQQQDQMEMLEAKEKFRLLVERGSDGILIMQENKIVYANRQTARMFGYQLEEFLEKPLHSLINRNRLKKVIDEYVQNSQSKTGGNHYELRIQRPNGGFGYVEAKVSIINYLGVKSRLIFLRDITKRKLAEKNSERYKNLLEQAQRIAKLGSWEWNIQQKTLYCSADIYNILEVPNDESIIRDTTWMAKFVDQIDKMKIYRGLIQSINSGIKYEVEFPIVSEKGTRKTIHSQSQVFNDTKGQPERIIGTWLDISERIRLEQVLKEAKLRAEESDNLKSAFLSNMSHEIRTPMNAILGFASLLKNRQLDDKVHYEYIGHILQSGEGLIKLINDIIDISKIEANQLTIEKSPVRLNDVLNQIYNRYDELLLIDKNENIKLRLEKAFPDADFTILGDSYRLQQVICYLMTNAIKFTPKGTITFGYNIMNSELIFFVKDQGIGIPANKKELIFRSFGKLEGPQRMNKSGTGLGLSISKSLVGLMEGRIWFDTDENKGTQFYFTIPLEFSKQKATVKKESTSSDINKIIDLTGRSILIAEDELLNYKLLETLLKRTGAQIIWAKNGIEAVNMASNHKVDLIFMDIKMPEMNGYEATKAIKQIYPNLPIIAQTAFAFANEQQYILQSGCDMYLTKPINHLEVFKALNAYLA